MKEREIKLIKVERVVSDTERIAGESNDGKM